MQDFYPKKEICYEIAIKNNFAFANSNVDNAIHILLIQ
ncbi:hypothetical protein Q361_11429 [Flavobacterium croceum DSM 17960]|uniref:Uncharacterized protein n=1 Tax=Flavobacterium croceum DSM 17960 TaxID=1121886 RepID=A0A2S4N6W0_9FLAO|nr:hypothetical protein Q361_11429 [Flavobacterium croceum DSM 17960]